MRSIFEPAALSGLKQRIEKLDALSTPKWGKMNSAQMLAHCSGTMEAALGELKLKRNFLSLFGWMFKGMIISDKPFSKNSPTAAEYRIIDQREFETEKKRFDARFSTLAEGPQTVKCFDHPFFGKMTAEDWGHLLYKHLDHHLSQFGI